MPLDPVHTLEAWSALMRSNEWGAKIATYAKNTHNEDLLQFLTLMRDNRRDANAYKVFIQDTSIHALHFDQELRVRFDNVANQTLPNWAQAPWQDAINVILDRFNGNIAFNVR